MNCPNEHYDKKKKLLSHPIELAVKRTTQTPQGVRRERYCNICKKTIYTLERFELDINKEFFTNEEKIRDIQHNAEAKQQKLDQLYHLKEALKDFLK